MFRHVVLLIQPAMQCVAQRGQSGSVVGRNDVQERRVRLVGRRFSRVSTSVFDHDMSVMTTKAETANSSDAVMSVWPLSGTARQVEMRSQFRKRHTAWNDSAHGYGVVFYSQHDLDQRGESCACFAVPHVTFESTQRNWF